MRHGVKSLEESWRRAECAPGRTQDEREPPEAMAHGRRLIFCTRNRTDPISGFAENGDAPAAEEWLGLRRALSAVEDLA